MRKFLFCLAILVVGLTSCSAAPVINRVPGADQEEGETTRPEDIVNTLEVCSFNLRYFNTTDPYPWSVRKDPSIKFIKETQPDFVGFQEIREPQGKDLEAGLRDDYIFYGIGRDTGLPINASDGEGVGLMFKKSRFDLVKKGFFWLSEEPDKLPKRNEDGTYTSWHCKCRRNVTWVKVKDKLHNNQEIYFFSTHFDHVSSQARLESSKMIVEHIKKLTGVKDLLHSEIPIFLVADFNCSYDSSELAPLSKFMIDARLKSSKTDFGTTFNGFKEGQNKLIDHIFYVGELDPVQFEVVTKNYGVKYISDHYPIVFHCTYK